MTYPAPKMPTYHLIDPDTATEATPRARAVAALYAAEQVAQFNTQLPAKM